MTLEQREKYVGNAKAYQDCVDSIAEAWDVFKECRYSHAERQTLSAKEQKYKIKSWKKLMKCVNEYLRKYRAPKQIENQQQFQLVRTLAITRITTIDHKVRPVKEYLCKYRAPKQIENQQQFQLVRTLAITRITTINHEVRRLWHLLAKHRNYRDERGGDNFVDRDSVIVLNTYKTQKVDGPYRFGLTEETRALLKLLEEYWAGQKGQSSDFYFGIPQQCQSGLGADPDNPNWDGYEKAGGWASSLVADTFEKVTGERFSVDYARKLYINHEAKEGRLQFVGQRN
ncbi:hypothetical protein HDV00_009820 [Rhizophlyctis rosea]|nr:hypothetical protein HDV00_009820 [Rhizophlyctis rosea]